MLVPWRYCCTLHRQYSIIIIWTNEDYRLFWKLGAAPEKYALLFINLHKGLFSVYLNMHNLNWIKLKKWKQELSDNLCIHIWVSIFEWIISHRQARRPSLRNFKTLFGADNLISNIPSVSQNINYLPAYTNNILFKCYSPKHKRVSHI